MTSPTTASWYFCVILIMCLYTYHDIIAHFCRTATWVGVHAHCNPDRHFTNSLTLRAFFADQRPRKTRLPGLLIDARCTCREKARLLVLVVRSTVCNMGSADTSNSITNVPYRITIPRRLLGSHSLGLKSLLFQEAKRVGGLLAVKKASPVLQACLVWVGPALVHPS